MRASNREVLICSRSRKGSSAPSTPTNAGWLPSGCAGASRPSAQQRGDLADYFTAGNQCVGDPRDMAALKARDGELIFAVGWQ